jgi:hypothetical protein
MYRIRVQRAASKQKVVEWKSWAQKRESRVLKKWEYLLQYLWSPINTNRTRHGQDQCAEHEYARKKWRICLDPEKRQNTP